MSDVENMTVAALKLGQAKRGVSLDPIDDWYSADFVVQANSTPVNGAEVVQTTLPTWTSEPDLDFTVVGEAVSKAPVAVRCLHSDPAEWY